MAKPELGLKRLCSDCGAKFYDLNRSRILCPKCGAEMVVKTAPETQKPKEVEKPAEELSSSEEGPEIISLDDASAEEEAETDEAAAANIDDSDVEVGDIGGGDEFLEDDVDDGNDVSDIITAPLDDEES